MSDDGGVSARELAARAICRVRKLPENVTFDGAPLWQRFLPEADAVLKAIGWAVKEASDDKPAQNG